jgi:hypothetical protein
MASPWWSADPSRCCRLPAWRAPACSCLTDRLGAARSPPHPPPRRPSLRAAPCCSSHRRRRPCSSRRWTACCRPTTGKPTRSRR